MATVHMRSRRSGQDLREVVGKSNAAFLPALNAEQWHFLRAVAAHGPTFRKGLPPGSDRPQDHARQKCKREGLVVYGAKGWEITDAGRAAIGAAQP